MNIFSGKIKEISTVAQTIFILGIISIITVLYLNSIRPQNSPVEAREFKKAHYVSSAKSFRIPILLYHYVEHVRDSTDFIRRGMNITPETFEIQLRSFIEQNYKTEFIKEISKFINGRGNDYSKIAAFTFDDGYESFYTNVFPILKKNNAKATVFIIADYIGRPGFLNETQIRELLESGLVEIGSHTMDHPELTTLSEKDARYQITQSKIVLEKMFNTKIFSFAYPYGKFSEKHVEFVRDAGYLNAVTVQEGIIQEPLKDFTLLRVRPERYIGYDMPAILEQSVK